MSSMRRAHDEMVFTHMLFVCVAKETLTIAPLHDFAHARDIHSSLHT